MKSAIVVILLAGIWTAVTGSATLANLILGLAVGALALALVRETIPPDYSRVRPVKLILLAGLFFRELALSAIRVAILVVRPKMVLKPGIFAYPLTLTRDFEITLLANLITLTPGTLTVDVSPDHKTLYIHALDCADPAAIRRDIASGFERRIREAFPA